jgi:hypothetical protein
MNEMPPGSRTTRAERWVIGLALATALVLAIIGVRFLVVPEKAAHFFGIARSPAAGAWDLNAVIGLRDIWLALILGGLAMLRQWAGVAIWLGLGAVVCFSDSAIAAASSGAAVSIAFHSASGVFCAGLAWAAWRLAQRS